MAERKAAADARFAQLEIRRRIYTFPGSGDRSAARGRLGNVMRWLLTGEERREVRFVGLRAAR